MFAGVDIGASSGRVVAGWFDADGPHLDVVHRFPNGAVESDGQLRWNLTGLYAEVLTGLTELAERYPGLVSIGIDTWAVDYGLLDADGQLIAEPISYRDSRTDAVIDAVHGRIDRARLYAVNGLQFLPFNTLYQLAAEATGPRWGQTVRALLLPDLLGFWLTGQARTESTNASTTGLLDATSRSWSPEVFDALGIPNRLFAELIEPGQQVGTIRPHVARQTRLPDTTVVIAVGSHDTASAVVGVPARDRNFAFVSSGTWSLVGLELTGPVLTSASRRENFTNEGGVDARVRYLRNVGGLWLLQESLQTWRQRGEDADLEGLLAAAATVPAGGPTIDVDDAEFIPPGNMPARIRAACAANGFPPPQTAADVVRCILDSLALAYARTIGKAQQLSGRHVGVVHIVGGGCQNRLLCQLTADLTGLSVLAGPVEATALGNLAVQARAAGVLPADLDELRSVLAEHLKPETYLPSPGH